MALIRPIARPAATMRVRLFGPLAVARDTTELDTTTWRRWVDTLFALLVTAPGRRRSRDEILALLWPDANPRSTAGTLRYLIHLLRHDLGGGDPSPVLSERGWIALNPLYEWDVDIERFEAALNGSHDNARLLEAAALRAGEPLFCARYDDWATPLRNRLQREWRDLCLALGRWRRDARDYGEALAWWERALEVNPFDEEVMEALLQTLVTAGRIPEALRRYGEYERTLRAELAVAPGATLQSLVERMRGASAGDVAGPDSTADMPFAPSYPPLSTGRLIGRETPLETLLAAWEPEHPQGPRLMLVTGEAGIGKTRLLAEIVRRARHGGAVVLASGCYEQEGRLPYSPIHDALLDYVRAQPDRTLVARLGDLRDDITRIVPELRARIGGADETGVAAGGERRLRLFSALAQLFERIAGERRLLLVIDDLQWADRATIQLLHYLARQQTPHGLRILGAYRDAELVAGAPLLDLLDETGATRAQTEQATRLALHPLDADETRALLEDQLAGDCARETCATIHQISLGNPFFTLQLLALLREDRQIEPVDGLWRLTGEVAVDLPPSVRETVARRLRGLGPAELETLRLAATLGQTFACEALEAMWSGGEEEMCAALDVLLEARLLREAGGLYSFTQPVLREVVYQGAATHRRRQLHKRAFHALRAVYGERERDHATELAWHCLQAGDRSQIRAYAMLAGDQALALYSLDEAERQYRTALDFLSPAQRGQHAEAELLYKLGRTLRLTPKTSDASACLDRAADLYLRLNEPALAVLALVNLAKTYLRGADPVRTNAALARVEALSDALATCPASAELVTLHEELGNVLFRSGRYQEALDAFERAAGAASTLDDEASQVRTQISSAVARAILGDVALAGDAARRLIPRAEAVGDREALRLALAQAAECAMIAGAFGESKAYRLRELDVATEIGPLPMAPFTRSNLAQVSLYLGEWETARRYAEESLVAFRACGNASRAAYPLSFLGELALWTGDAERAEQALDESARIARQVGDMQALRYAARILAERDIAAGAPERAILALEPLLDRPGLQELDVAYLLPTLAWAHLARGDIAAARTHVARALSRASAQGNRLVWQDALRVHGLTLACEGAWDGAAAALDEGLRMASAMPYPFAEARFWLATASVERRQRERARAQAARRRAATILRRLGARDDLARVETTLAAGQFSS